MHVQYVCLAPVGNLRQTKYVRLQSLHRASLMVSTEKPDGLEKRLLHLLQVHHTMFCLAGYRRAHATQLLINLHTPSPTATTCTPRHTRQQHTRTSCQRNPHYNPAATLPFPACSSPLSAACSSLLAAAASSPPAPGTRRMALSAAVTAPR